MKILESRDGKYLTLALEGRMDTTTAPQLEEVVRTELEDISKLVIDMKNLEYLSSAGLRVLLAAHKKMAGNGSMVIRNVNEIVMEVFEVTGFSDILIIE